MIRFNHPPFFWSLKEAPANSKWIRSLECDCACAVSFQNYENGIRPIISDFSPRQFLICNPAVITVRVDNKNYALFNPHSSQGIAVFNSSALEIYKTFQNGGLPESIISRSNGHSLAINQILHRMIEYEFLLPLDQRPQTLSFPVNQVLSAWLQISNACNMDCRYCYVNKDDSQMSETTARYAVAAIVRSALKNGYHSVHLKYAGGEPSLNPRTLFAAHDYAKMLCDAEGLHLSGVVLSNGVALNDYFIDNIHRRNIDVMISLDSLDDFQNNLRSLKSGSPSFSLIAKTIDRLRDNNIQPHVSITITRQNAQNLDTLVDFVLARDLTFSLNFYRNHSIMPDPDLAYNDEEMITALHKTFNVVERNLPEWSLLGMILDRAQLLQPRERPCNVGRDYVVINHKGGVAKCHMEMSKTVGNIKDSHDIMESIRNDSSGVQNLSVMEKSECKGCEWKFWCSGGCPLVTRNTTGSYDAKSPNCKIYKEIFPQAIRLEALRILKYAQNNG